MDTDEVPWPAAKRVVAALAERSIIDHSLTIDHAEVAFVRSGVVGPDGTQERWVDEILLEANAEVDGIAVLDAGLRIGITPAGEISSLRVTSIDVEQLDNVTIQASPDRLRDSFIGSFSDSESVYESIIVTRRRPVYILDPGAMSGVVEPRYLVAYSTTTKADQVLTASRSSMLLLGMTEPRPTIELRLPEYSWLPRASQDAP
ncbi:MAG: hypothetical protein AAGF11_47545 [Myxococcota bacterium]